MQARPRLVEHLVSCSRVRSLVRLCGTKVKRDAEVFYDNSKHLFEDAFLVAMKAMSSKPKSPEKSPNLSQERISERGYNERQGG